MFRQLCNKLKLNRKKTLKLRISVSLILLLSIFTGALTAYGESFHIVKLQIDNNSKYYRTKDTTVSDFLRKNEIELKNKDIINKDLNFIINSDNTIYINRAEEILFNIKGEEPKRFISNAENIENAILEFQKETGRSFKLEEGQNKYNPLSNNMTINLIPYKYKIKTVYEEIPFETTYTENPNLELGKEVVKIQGSLGKKEIKIKELYLEDKLIFESKSSEKIIKNPVNKVIEKGTKVSKPALKTNKGDFNYKKKISMKATAYTAGFESTGKKPGDKYYGITASGMKAQRGVVAVDTKVIPFGTKLYIDGYGHAIAGDRGGAIKGNKIDVFVDTVSEARKWGVRTVNVYILE